VKVRVGNPLGPHVPENVPSLKMRQPPPVSVRGAGRSMVTAAWDLAAEPRPCAIGVPGTAATTIPHAKTHRLHRPIGALLTWKHYTACQSNRSH
jgi:hypothetical protein